MTRRARGARSARSRSPSSRPRSATLSPEDFDEVYTAIATHEKKLLAERAQEKKRRMTDDAATSRSRSAAAGALTGSVS